MIKKVIHIFFLMFAVSASAQQFPLFSEYISNGLLLNPAYAGSRDVLSVSLMYRNDWVGVKGAPTYESFSMHTPTKNEKTGIGLLMLNENTGTTQNTHLYFNYSYLIKTDKGSLSLGLKAGVNYENFNYSKLKLNNPNDDAFAKTAQSYVLPNFGAGAYFLNSKFFLGVSIPYLLSYSQNQSRNGFELNHKFNQYDILITSGFLWTVSPEFKLKPSTLIKYNAASGPQVDININTISLDDKLWLGVGYRMFSAVASILEYQVNPQLRVGYSYDYMLGNQSYMRHSSHEFSLRYELSYRIKASNPRYF